MGKHTPGPWTHYGESVWSTHESVSGAATKGTRTNHVCAISNRLKMPEAEKVANARLIAASPDLLASVVSAENWLAEYETGPDSGLHGLLTQLRSAIAKATGE